MAVISSKDLVNCLPKDSWFRHYMKVWPLAEPPKSYIFFGAMAMMGAALGRKIWFPQDFRKLWPMVNLLLIGPSGIGKSTSIEMAQPLLGQLPKIEQPQFIIGGATPEKLHNDLLPNPHAVLFASELANFFNKQDYNAALIPYVTELLDYKPVEKRTKSGGIIRIDEPSVAVIGGSTVEWLQDQLPDTAVSGGFLARFIIVAEEHKGQKVASPEDALSPKALREMWADRDVVFAEFSRCVQLAEGAMRFKDYGAKDCYSVWYNSHNPVNGHLAPFAARAPENVKRMSMILAVSCGREMITEEDVEAGIKLYEFSESRLQQVVVPMTQEGKMLAMIKAVVGHNALTDVQIKQSMGNFMSSQKVDILLASLLQSKDLKLIEGKFVKNR